MPAPIVASLAHTFVHEVETHGVYAVFVLMALDALFPAAGELVMLYAGAIAAGSVSATIAVFGTRVSKGLDAYLVVATAGTLGYVVGAVAGWYVGRRGGRPLLERWAPRKLARADRWFERWGPAGVLLGRLTPLARSFVSIPAGALGMSFVSYLGTTLLGAAIWAFAFAGGGWALGGRYGRADHFFHFAEYAVFACAVGALVPPLGRLLLGDQKTDGRPEG